MTGLIQRGRPLRGGVTKREFLAAAAGASTAALLGGGAADAAPAAPTTPTAPTLASAVAVSVRFGAPLVVGQVPGGLRSAHVSSGGSAAGELTATVAAGGICWSLRRPDGVTEIDFRCWLSPAGAEVVVMSVGALLGASRRGPASVIFESGPRYAGLRAQQRPGRVTVAGDMSAMTVEVFDVR